MKRILWALVAVVTFLGLLGLAYGCVQCPDSCDEVVVDVAASSGQLRKAIVPINANRGGGEAYGSGTTSIFGRLYAIDIDYRGSISTTTDITISYLAPSWGTLYTNANSATDVMTYPRQSVNNYGEYYLLDGTVKLELAQTQLFTPCVTMTLYYLAP